MRERRSAVAGRGWKELKTIEVPPRPDPPL